MKAKYSRSLRAAIYGLLATAILALPPSIKSKPAKLPEEFTILFSFGYGGDDLFPKEPETYEALLKKVKAAGFTTVMGTHEEWKVELCEKHGLTFMVNLLTGDHHVYKSPAGAEKLCLSLRDDKRIWGYHLFSDMNYKTVDGRNRDIDNVHRWDPTHPTFVGSYKLSGNSRLTNPDVHAYYDFHWQRGPHHNFPHLASASKTAKEKGCLFYRWIRVSSARPGNPDRIRYTVNTSIACGLKGVFWFLGQEMMERKTWEWNGYGGDVAKVNLETVPLGPELMRFGNVEAIHSTKTTTTSKGREKGADEPDVPKPFAEIPDGHWFQVEAGEALIGEFRDPDDASGLYFANHNAHGPQEMEVRFSPAPKEVLHFDRTGGAYRKIEVTGGTVTFGIGNGGGELLKIIR